MIRKITADDREVFLKFIKDFYNSEAVLHPIDVQFNINTFEEMLRREEYLVGYFIIHEEKEIGYILLSKSFSPEVGGPVVWVEEVYVLPEYRSMGFGRRAFEFVDENIPYCRLRLEVEPDNVRAKKFYDELGFKPLPYEQLIKDTV